MNDVCHDSEPGGLRREIAALELDANDAFLRRDVERLDRLFSDGLLVNLPIDRVNDKKTILHPLGAGIVGHVGSTISHELMSKDRDLVIVMGADAVAPFSHAVELAGWLLPTRQMPTDPNDDGAPLPAGIEPQARR